MDKNRVAIFASGNGSNAEEIIKYFASHPHIEVSLLLSNNINAIALQRAKRWNIETHVFDRVAFAHGDTILQLLREKKITHIVLAGFLWLIPPNLIGAYPDRIINIHPALLPKFAGRGMFGMNVHEAVRASGESETGITIHLVNEHYDEGKILFQGKCSVDANCSAEEIAKRVHALEYEHYSKVIETWILESGK
jgi:phosphoribosylglycinamide formyltransferase 1